ncbi:hypothetical protein A2943_01420 [Candidatus Adlerbacteria bacterium RIFCSPLOWO2_01_FULL_51_16]|uniref:Uncharacterized protein n=1 Tax=Candidatus Adlerbacteria bacterium RIFCSPLOWO2_01_FULL_51_16 TaxID=1797243 RepID=A0A1F4XHM7_9BACT|nr:MAG: hypothetical protein A2943_01420 [Candidatus Adlerbacteria bacterium RIFCSPLOWO2_01_FULL_51_16]
MGSSCGYPLYPQELLPAPISEGVWVMEKRSLDFWKEFLKACSIFYSYVVFPRYAYIKRNIGKSRLIFSEGLQSFCLQFLLMFFCLNPPIAQRARPKRHLQ